MDKEEYIDVKKRMREFQYNIPTSMTHLAYSYKDIPWYIACELYKLSVQEVLIYFNKECLYDIPFGRGSFIAKNIFSEKLKTYNNIMKEKEII